MTEYIKGPEIGSVFPFFSMKASYPSGFWIDRTSYTSITRYWKPTSVLFRCFHQSSRKFSK